MRNQPLLIYSGLGSSVIQPWNLFMNLNFIQYLVAVSVVYLKPMGRIRTGIYLPDLLVGLAAQGHIFTPKPILNIADYAVTQG